MDRLEEVSTSTAKDGATHDVLVSVLGAIRLSADGKVVPIASGSKAEQILVSLVLERHHRLPRSDLLERVWPSCPMNRSGQCLNSLIHQLNKEVVAHAGGVQLIVNASGFYRLNPADEVTVDSDRFDRWSEHGMRLLRRGDPAGLPYCLSASDLYRGEFCAGTNVDVLIERERLRATFLNLLACLADHALAAGDHAIALRYVQRLLELDCCREDAHRQAMLCYTRLGLRSQALRQYRVCREALEREFDAVPEPKTEAMFDVIRVNPDSLEAEHTGVSVQHQTDLSRNSSNRRGHP